MQEVIPKFSVYYKFLENQTVCTVNLKCDKKI